MFNVVILAAGVGSRLAPLTDTVPKALIRVNQKSILHYELEALDSVPDGSRILIVTGHLAHLIRQEIDRLDSRLDIT
ncbi:MAG: sugar phosphate nucleotidyltransferase [Candidatus Thorarchaeota archaeon]|jgi:choline kinase